MAVLGGPAFQGDNGAAVDLLEIPEREAHAAFRLIGFVVVVSQVPFREISEAMLVDEGVFVVGRWCVLTPVITDVAFNLPVLDEFARASGPCD